MVRATVKAVMAVKAVRAGSSRRRRRMSPDSFVRQRDQSAEPDDVKTRAAVLESEPWLIAYGDDSVRIAELRRRSERATAGAIYKRKADHEGPLHLRQRDEDGQLMTSLAHSKVFAHGNEVGDRPAGGEKAQP
jgi:hypothetical protein